MLAVGGVDLPGGELAVGGAFGDRHRPGLGGEQGLGLVAGVDDGGFELGVRTGLELRAAVVQAGDAVHRQVRGAHPALEIGHCVLHGAMAQGEGLDRALVGGGDHIEAVVQRAQHVRAGEVLGEAAFDGGVDLGAADAPGGAKRFLERRHRHHHSLAAQGEVGSPQGVDQARGGPAGQHAVPGIRVRGRFGLGGVHPAAVDLKTPRARRSWRAPYSRMVSRVPRERGKDVGLRYGNSWRSYPQECHPGRSAQRADPGPTLGQRRGARVEAAMPGVDPG